MLCVILSPGQNENGQYFMVSLSTSCLPKAPRLPGNFRRVEAGPGVYEGE